MQWVKPLPSRHCISGIVEYFEIFLYKLQQCSQGIYTYVLYKPEF